MMSTAESENTSGLTMRYLLRDNVGQTNRKHVSTETESTYTKLTE